MTLATASYSEKVNKVVELFTGLTVMELVELQKALEDIGIKPAAVAIGMPAGMAAGGAAGGEPVEEKTTFDVVLKSVGAEKIKVIKVVREITSLGLKEAKELVEGAPKPVKQGVTKDEAESLKKKLVEVGAEVEFK